MKFGLRAKSIKNKAKINREFTVPELKKLLEKKEIECTTYQKRLLSLIDWCKKNGT